MQNSKGPINNLQEHLHSAFASDGCRNWGLLYSLPSQNAQAAENGASGCVGVLTYWLAARGLALTLTAQKRGSVWHRRGRKRGRGRKGAPGRLEHRTCPVCASLDVTRMQRRDCARCELRPGACPTRNAAQSPSRRQPCKTPR